MKSRAHPRSGPCLILASLSCLLGPGAAWGQQSGFVVTSGVNLTETVTNNVNLDSSKSGGTDWITQIAPSIKASSDSGRIKGSVQVGLVSSLYGNDSSLNRNDMTLNGKVSVEAWENHGYVDLLGTVSREVVSVFGARPSDSVTGSNNQASVKSFTIAPNLRGSFGATGSANVRYALSTTQTGADNVNNSSNQTLLVNLSDPAFSGKLGWGVNGQQSVTQTENQRDVKQQTVRFTGSMLVDPQVSVRLILGRESNTYSSASNTSSTIKGVGADWSPSPLTRISGTLEDRIFGTGYNFSINNETGRFAFKLLASRDTSSMSSSLYSGLSLYDLLMAAYASTYPNPTVRDTEVRRIIATQYGGRGNAIVGAQPVLTNSVFVDRRFQLGVSLIGVRNSVVFSAYRSKRNSLTERDFAIGSDLENGKQVDDEGASLGFSHQLTPVTSANVALSVSHSKSDDGSNTNLSSRSRLISGGLSTRFTSKTSGSLLARTNKGSGSRDYTENALVGTIGITF